MNATVEYTEDKTSKMAEIITRYKQYPPEAIMFQAAKEIAELQAENDKLRKKLKAETCKYNPGCLLYTTLGKELDEYDTEM